MTKEELIAKEFSKNIIPVTWKGICNNASQMAGEDYYEFSSDQMLEVDEQSGQGIGETYTQFYCGGINNCFGRDKYNCLKALEDAIDKYDNNDKIDWKKLKDLCHEVCYNSRCDCIKYLDFATKNVNDPNYRLVDEYYVQQRENEPKEITPKQLEYIAKLVKEGAPKFIGKTRKEASEYIEKWQELSQTITKKQMKYIAIIEKDAPKFTGKTRKEASDYINKYKKSQVPDYNAEAVQEVFAPGEYWPK